MILHSTYIISLMAAHEVYYVSIISLITMYDYHELTSLTNIHDVKYVFDISLKATYNAM